MRSNLRYVIKFEIIRNLKKPTFWLAAFILPLLLVGYIALAGLSGYNASTALEQTATYTSELKLGIYDAAGYISATTLTDPDGRVQELTIFDSKEQGIAAVKNNDIHVFYYLPPSFTADLTANIYAKSDTVNIFTSYESPIRALLATAAASHVDPIDFAVISGAVQVNTTNFSLDNTEIDTQAQIARMVIPLIVLALFYVLICLFGNRLTTAMVEEKENRISEMILTSLNPTDLITGKIISLIILGFIQLAALTIPLLIVAAFGFNSGLIPTDFPIDLNFWSILSSLLLLIFSYFLFTGLCVTIGTLVPTAKDAGNFAAVIIILVILPLFFINSFLSPQTANFMTYFLSYFPPSAPIALMFRNAFGTLPVWELFLGLIVLAIASYLIIKLAVFVYSRTAIEFTAKVNLRKLLTSPRKSWKE